MILKFSWCGCCNDCRNADMVHNCKKTNVKDDFDRSNY